MRVNENIFLFLSLLIPFLSPLLIKKNSPRSLRGVKSLRVPFPTWIVIAVAIIRLSFHKFAYLPSTPAAAWKKRPSNHSQERYGLEMEQKKAWKGYTEAKLVDREMSFVVCLPFYILEADKSGR